MSEELLQQALFIMIRLVEAAGALVIFSGAVAIFVRLIIMAVTIRKGETFTKIRLDLGRMLALGLEFHLASDLLQATVAPSFEEIAKLAAIATIRTGLNYFLNREIKEAQAEIMRNREEEHG